MNKKKIIGLVAALVCLALLVGIIVYACTGPAQGGQDATGGNVSAETVDYRVQVQNEAGMPLAGVGVYVYTDSTLGELVWFDRTDDTGTMTFTAAQSSSYVAVLGDVPTGYAVEAYYGLTGELTQIVLSAAVMDENNTAELKYALGDMLMDFSITDTEGKTYTISELLKEKKAVVLNFWYLQCAPCKAEFPFLQEAYAQYSDLIEVIAMNPLNENTEEIAKFKKELGITFPMAYCGSQWESIMQLTAYPTTVIIDRYGMITLIHKGSVPDTKTFADAFAYFTAEEYEQKVIKDIEELLIEGEEGTEDNPIELGGTDSFEVTVAPGKVVYTEIYKAINMYLQVRGENAYVIYEGKTYKAEKGVVGLMVSCPDTYTPILVGIGNSGDKEATFKATLTFPQGTYGNPYKLTPGEFTTKVSAGNDQGVYYTYTATEAGVLSLQCLEITSGVAYDYTVYNLDGNIYRTMTADGSADGIVSVNVNAGDKVLISLVTVPDSSNNYPAATFRTLATFTPGEGRKEEEQVEKAVYTVTVKDTAGNPMPGVLMKAVGETPAEGKATEVVLTTDENGVATGELPVGNYTVTVTVPNGYTAENAVLNLTKDAPSGQITLTPIVIEWVDYTITVLSPEGEPVPNAKVIIGEASAQTNAQGAAVFNLQKGEHTLYLTDLPADFAAESSYALTAQSLNLEIRLAYKPGSAENPHIQSVDAVPGSFETKLTEAGSEQYYLIKGAAGTKLTIADADAYIIYNGTTYGKDNQDAVVVELATGTAGDTALVIIGNAGQTSEVFLVNITYPVGAVGNPKPMERLKNTELTLYSGDADGYCYSWTAQEDGTVSFAVTSADITDPAVPELQLHNLRSGEKRTLSQHGVSDADGVKWVNVDVEKGETVNIHVYLTQTELYPECSLTLGAQFMTVEERFVISVTSQPEVVEAKLGEAVRFAVGAEGVGLSYQWQSGKGGTWTDIAEATKNELTLTAALAHKNTAYRCKISNAYGNTVYTRQAELVLKASAPIAVTAQPQDVQVDVGQNAVFSVSATGDSLRYQWQRYDTVAMSWSNLTETATTLTVAVNADLDGTLYRCLITDAIGDVLTTQTVTLRVYQLQITAQPEDTAVADGENAAFTVEASGEGLSYLWQYSTDAGATWTDTNVTASTITLQTELSQNGWLYRCAVSDNRNNSLVTDAAVLTVEVNTISIQTQPQDASAAVGDAVHFAVEATGESVSYLWQYSTDAGATWVDTQCTESTLQLTAAAANNGWLYRCFLTDTSGCTRKTNAAALTIQIKITAHPQVVDTYAGDPVTLAASATGDGLRYQWKHWNAVLQSWENVNCTETVWRFTADMTQNGAQYCCQITDAKGNSILTDPATVTVTEKTPAQILTQPMNTAVYTGKTASFTVSATGYALSYQWQCLSGGVWTDVQGADGATLTVNADAAMNGLQYRCVVTGGVGGSVTSNAATLTVRQPVQITAHPAAANATEGDTHTFTVTATGYALSYQWQYLAPGASDWTNVENANAASLTRTLVLDQNGSAYRCVITDDGGNTAVSNQAAVTVSKRLVPATYTVTVTDYAGTPAAGITVAFVGAEETKTAVTGTNGAASLVLMQGDYTVVLSGTTAYYEKSTAKLTANKTELTVLLAAEPDASSKPEIYVTDSGYGYALGVGGTHVLLGSGQEGYSTEQGVTMFRFTPRQPGLYRFTTSNPDAVISYWGTAFIFNSVPDDYANNAFTINVHQSNIGSDNSGISYVIGVSGTGECAVVISRLGDPDFDPNYQEEVIYTGSGDPSAYTFPGGTLTAMEVSQSYVLVYSEADGYYHLGAVNGPVVMARLRTAPYVSFDIMINGNGQFGGQGLRASWYDDAGNFIKEDYTDLMNKYIASADSATGVYPLTKDLAYMIQKGSTYLGWTDPANPNFLFAEVENYNRESGWMFCLCYVAE